MNNVADISNQLNKINFITLTKYKVGEALGSAIYSYNNKIKYKELFHMFISILLFQNYTFNKHENKEIVFLFSNSYASRGDHLETFLQLTQLFSNRVDIIPNRKFGIKIDRLFYSFILLIWIFQLRKINISFDFKVYLILSLYLGIVDSSFVSKWIINNASTAKILITFCDIHAVDYFVTKRVSNRLRTVTVQHGHFLAGWQFSYSPSEIFLVHSKYAKKLAVLSGKAEDKVIPVGLMQYIDVDKKILLSQDKSETITPNLYFGVLLNGVGFDEDNRNMLKDAVSLASKIGYKFLVRFHPSNNKDEYFDLLNTSYYVENLNRESIVQFANRIEFALLGKTTVFIEFHLLNKPCFRYHSGGTDIFNGINYNSYSCFDELLNNYNYFKENLTEFMNHLIRAKNELVMDGDIKKNYYNAIIGLL